MWYAQRQRGRTSQKAKRDHYLHLSDEQKSLLQRLVNQIDTCDRNNSISSNSTKANTIDQKSNFMHNYHQNVKANRNAELLSTIKIGE